VIIAGSLFDRIEDEPAVIISLAILILIAFMIVAQSGKDRQ
jgi:hypothetical protein